MSEVRALLAEAQEHYEAGRTADSYATCGEALKRDPENAAALELMGVLASRLGEVETAVRMLERAVMQRPGEARLLTNLGAVYRAAGRLEEAEARYRDALALEPEALPARFNLANLLMARGEPDAALREYMAIVECDPTNAGALNNMAAVLKQKGRYAEAEAVYRQLIAARPNDATMYCNLGVLCMERGRLEEAIALYRTAIGLDPVAVEPYNNLGVALQFLNRMEEALDAFDHALTLDAQNSEVHCNRAQALARAGEPEAADDAIARALAIRPDPRYRLVHAGLLPVVPRSIDDLQRWRHRFTSEVKLLIEEGLVVQGSPLDIPMMSFYLAYHGENDRDIMESLSRLYRQAYPSLQWTASHCTGQARPRTQRRIRVGLVSSYLREHAVAWTMQGLLEHLPRDKFEIFIYSTGRSGQPILPRIAAVADHQHVLPYALEPARRLIAEAELDVLVYADIGMENLSTCLAHARLAPVQCATWGHPVTTGIPTVDYFISSDIAEPSDAQLHYSETLIRLSGVQTCYRRPAFPTVPRPSPIPGLPAGSTIYLCPQSLFKIHPDMDRPLAEILQRDPAGVLVAFEGSAAAITARLRDRWRAALGDCFARVRFLPRVALTQFLAILAAADVLLDTWPFGGGNTSYQGFAAGVPIVTLPGRFLRGRGTAALYRHMNYKACIADSTETYVDIAVRLGTDADFRAEVAGVIHERSGLLFDDESVGRDFAQFLIEVIG